MLLHTIVQVHEGSIHTLYTVQIYMYTHYVNYYTRTTMVLRCVNKQTLTFHVFMSSSKIECRNYITNMYVTD